MLKSPKIWLAVAGVALAAAGGYWLLRTHSDAGRDAIPDAPPVVTEPAEPERPSADSPETVAAAPRFVLSVEPAELTLAGPGDGCQLVVTRQRPDGTAEDITRTCRFEPTPASAVEISGTGYLRAVMAGTVTVTAIHDDNKASVALTISDDELPVSDFALDIVPILTRAGCNTGQCHGAAQGKGGFNLSLFGYNPEADFASITRDIEGRRLNRSEPEASLFLLKPTLAVPHGGRVRVREGSPEHERLLRWVRAGTPWRDDSRGRLNRLVVEPADRFLTTAPAEQQLRAIAEYADGSRRDVTRLCLFISNDPATLSVDKNGLVRMLRRGQADVVIRFANKVATARLAAPFNDSIDHDYAAVPKRNFIDDRVMERLVRMRLPVSPRSSDAEFLRRVYFDLVGHMPDPNNPEDFQSLQTFLDDPDPEKRDKLIDRLLRHPDFATFWTLKLGDHLQLSSATMGPVAGAYRGWLAEQLKLDKSGNAKPFGEFVRLLLVSKGKLGRKPEQPADPDGRPAVYYAFPAEPGDIAEQVARRFLGVRIRCARCHDHPLDVWTQDDYYSFASFFGTLRVEASGEPPSMDRELKVGSENAVRHLRTGATPQATYLGGGTAEIPEGGDPRQALVDWMLSPDNPWFSRMVVNWVWAHLMGRGIVDPVDDMRFTNPPVNRELLDELARHFVESSYDLRAVVRTICRSETYQRASTALEGNEADEQFFSHALLKPLTAHQMADAVSMVTGVSERYTAGAGGEGMVLASRAIDINDPGISSYLLDVLGRCDRTGGCEVGAMARPTSLKQSLHLILGEAINEKLTARGTSRFGTRRSESGQQDSVVVQMADYARDSDESRLPEVRRLQIESIYLRAYCRRPTAEETAFWEKELTAAGDYATGLEDMVWAIVNSREFAFNH